MVVLYIFEHEKTGLKYFGKTTKYINEKLLSEYDGSRTEWKEHLKMHGNHIKKTILGIYSLDENSKNYVKPVALKFSKENDIVNSKEWANMIPENGLNGGTLQKGCVHSEETKKRMSLAKLNSSYKHSEETRKKIGEASRGRVVSSETKMKISKNRKGKGQINLSDEHKMKISNTLKEKAKTPEMQEILRRPKGKQEKVICPYCNKEGGISNMKRYHFKNCKKYIIQP